MAMVSGSCPQSKFLINFLRLKRDLKAVLNFLSPRCDIAK